MTKEEKQEYGYIDIALPIAPETPCTIKVNGKNICYVSHHELLPSGAYRLYYPVVEAVDFQAMLTEQRELIGVSVSGIINIEQ
jgi:hypothetical protein